MAFLSHLSFSSFFPYSLSFCLSLCPLLFPPLRVRLSLPACPLCLFFCNFLALLFFHSDLTEGLLHWSHTCYSFSLSLSLSLSLEENHTLISLPALFLTSRLARRILMKLLSQLTPKAHNNLLCQQTHSHAHSRTLTHTFICAAHA